MGKIEAKDVSKFAFLSDIHGNSPALRSVLDDIRHEQCKKVFVLGDIVNGIDPHGCVRILHSWSDENGIDLVCIKGNAEGYLATPDRDSLIQQNNTLYADMDVLKSLQWYQAHLSGPDMDWISSLPDTIRWNGVFLVHDSPMDRLVVQSQTGVPLQYRELNYHGRGISPDMTKSEWEELINYMRLEGMTQVFSGHTHCPFYREFDGLLVCNVGSAGMPLDGDPRPSWAMLTVSNSGSQSVSIRRVDYDISAMLQLIDSARDFYDIRETGFSEAYKKMFLHGRFWREFMPGNSD
jgi:predicted phosphodiesterase